MKLADLSRTASLKEAPADQLTPAELASMPTVLVSAGGFTVDIDNNENISIKDQNNKKLVVMPFVIWKQLCRS